MSAKCILGKLTDLSHSTFSKGVSREPEKLGDASIRARAGGKIDTGPCSSQRGTDVIS